MSYDEQRQVLESRLRPAVSIDDARLIAYAQLPWLDQGRATYGFFEAMIAERDGFVGLGRLDLADTEGLVRAATTTVERYSALARRFGARRYESTADALLRGVVPAVGRPSRAPVSEAGTVPRALSLIVGATELRLEAIESKKGNVWYTLLSDTGSALRGGIRVAPDRPGLPDTVRLGDVDLVLGPAPLWDDESRQYSEVEDEPFDVKRLVERDVVLGEHAFRVRILVSARRDGAWNVTARLWPQEPVRFNELGGVHHPAPRSPAVPGAGASPRRMSDAGRAGETSENLDLLLETLRDATG